MKKTDILKKLIKEAVKDAVKEAFQEEIKEILFEMIKSNKPPIMESSGREINFTSKDVGPAPATGDVRQQYMNSMDILKNMANPSRSSNGGGEFTPPTTDVVNGNLGEGEVSLDQISKILNNQ